MTDEQKAARAAKVRAGVAKAKAKGTYSAMRQRIWDEMTPEKRAEWGRLQSENRKREWAERGPDRNSVPGFLQGRTSEQEIALAPYLEKFGFVHNDANTDGRKTFIGRKVPDYVNFFDRKLFEYFGVRHHDPEEAEVLIDYYASKGWDCTILWEYDLFQWLEEHRHLVTDEEHDFAWKAALCKRSKEAADLAIQREIAKRAARTATNL